MADTSSRVDYRPPGGRVCPPEVVAQLREIDPLAEIVYRGNGWWVLGTVKPDRIRYLQAVRALGAYYSLLTRANRGEITLNRKFKAELRLRLGKKLLQLQGWREVTAFRQAVPDSGIVEVFRASDWLWRHRFREVEREKEREAEGTVALEKRRAVFESYMDQEHRSIHRHVFRKAHGILQPGMPGSNPE